MLSETDLDSTTFDAETVERPIEVTVNHCTPCSLEEMLMRYCLQQIKHPKLSHNRAIWAVTDP